MIEYFVVITFGWLVAICKGSLFSFFRLRSSSEMSLLLVLGGIKHPNQ